MILAIKYNCTPDSLADVPEEDFVDAIENEMMCFPAYRECCLTVSFKPALTSSVIGVVTSGDDSDCPSDYDAALREMANAAFRNCCEEIA